MLAKKLLAASGRQPYTPFSLVGASRVDDSGLDVFEVPIPASAQEGDLMVFFGMGGANGGDPVINEPDWTVIYDLPNSDLSADNFVLLAYKLHSGSEPASITIDQGGGAIGMSASIVALSGVEVIGNSAWSNGNSVSLIPTNSGSAALFFHLTDNSTGQNFGVVTDFTKVLEIAYQGYPSDQHAVYYAAPGDSHFSVNGSSVGNDETVFLVELVLP